MSVEKQAADKAEGEQRLMAFATGIGRYCEDAEISYSDLAKQANVSEEMLAPTLAEVVVDAAKQAEKA
jgi:predicted regulator of amino acid metabolism with ACT domain